MTKEELIAAIEKLPMDTEIFVARRAGEAYPAAIYVINEPDLIYACIEIDRDRLDEHRNLPQKGRK